MKNNDIITKEKLSVFRSKLIETLQVFDRFCSENGLTYFCGYGTLIGCMRHKGFIPWDDDIDVLMLRKDYDRMLRIHNVPKGYELVTPYRKGYYLPFAKFCDASTTLIEYKEWPFILGVYIDIFPLDEVNTDIVEIYRAKFKQIYARRKVGMAGQYHKRIIGALKTLKFRNAAVWMRALLWDRYHCSRYHIQLRRIVEQRGNTLVCYCGPYKKEVCRKEWFAGIKRVPFESIMVNVPVGYDDYLRNLYGNYMKLPPPSEQKSHHSHYYLNLECREGL